MKLRVILWLIVITSLLYGLPACDRSITNIEAVQTSADCFSCHTDADTRLVAAEQQWLYSRHASGGNIDRAELPCSVCHTSEGFVALATGQAVPSDVANPTVIHCFTCHAPHTGGDLSLRVSEPATLQNGETADLGSGNLCVACHQSRRNVDAYVRTASDTVVFTSSHWGPHHSPQGDMLIGSNGYEFPLVPYFKGPHLDETDNGCVDCHFNVARKNRVGGHSFNMRWPGQGEEIINTDACNQSGCHTGLDSFNHDDIQTTVDTLLATLKPLLVGAGLIDATDHTIEGRVVASSDSAGVVWNYLLALEDRSRGVHNPDYVPDLLGSSILFMGGSLPASVAGRFSQTGRVKFGHQAKTQ
jgi:hypothetical protein